MVIRQNQTAWNNSVSGSRICRACNGFDFHPRNSKFLHFLRTTTQQQGNLTTDLFCFLSGDDFKPVWILRSPTSFCNSTSGLSVALQELFVQVSVSPQRPPTGLLLIFLISHPALQPWIYGFTNCPLEQVLKHQKKKVHMYLLISPTTARPALIRDFKTKAFHYQKLSVEKHFCSKLFFYLHYFCSLVPFSFLLPCRNPPSSWLQNKLWTTCWTLGNVGVEIAKKEKKRLSSLVET